LISPLNDDTRIYQGVASLTDYFGSFPANINNAWEIKPIANRGINYILYKISTLFTTITTPEYEFVIKLLSLIIVIIICYYFASKFKHQYLFLLTTVCFIGSLNFVSLQAEWWASLFSLISIALFMTDKPSNHYLSGLVITIMFLFKGITILLILPMICAIYLFKPDWFNRLKLGLVGSVLSLLFILTWNIFDKVVPDMLLSSQIAHVGYFSVDKLASFFLANSIFTLFHIPIIICGLVASVYLFNKYMYNRDLFKVVILILMWITSISIVLIQSEFFIYHYFVLVIPSIISIILICDLLKSNSIIKVSLIVAMILFLLMTSYWSIGATTENQFWQRQDQIAIDVITNFTDITNQTSILYLDPGNAPYYFRSNSSCRYISPLPFQRNSEEWDISYTDAYKEEYNCIMNYDGKYIITASRDWIIQNTTDGYNVSEKFKTEYKQVWDKGWNIYMNLNTYDILGREVR
jgi:hypothetical protein